jgi:HD superfamily phosphodiesterase
MIQDVTNAMIEYFCTDVARINHALKVFGFAGTISRSEKLTPDIIEKIEITALLHDIGIPNSEKKYKSSAGKYQEAEGPPVAREILQKLNYNAEIIERVCFIIGNHHTYSKIDDIDFQILVEADFLVNIFEDAMAEESVSGIRSKFIKTQSCRQIFDRMYTSLK